MEPAFETGELLILTRDGREVGYPQRKPSKWRGIEYSIFDDLETAITLVHRMSTEARTRVPEVNRLSLARVRRYARP